MGQGIISVSSALFEQQKPIKGLDGDVIAEAGEPIQQPQTLAEWHALLMLPEEFRLLEVKADAMYPLWLLTVESKAIPDVEGKLPDVTPIFRAEYNTFRNGREEKSIQINYLARIEISTPSHCVIWPEFREVKTQGISLQKKGKHNKPTEILPKHDGNLNEDGTRNVYYNNFGGVAIAANDVAWMSASEALSLLEWLEQEKGKLELLAKEQA